MATKNLDNILIVVGIDFGTSNSAYAYSYAYEKDKIYINSDWPSGSKTCKEVTAILFNEDKEFKAFGEEAVEMYNNLTNYQLKCWHLFNHFKMKLHNKKVSSYLFSLISYLYTISCIPIYYRSMINSQ